MALCRCLCPFAAIRKQLLDYKFKTFAKQVLAPISSCRTEIARVSQKATLRDSPHSCFQRGSLNPRFDVSAKLISTTSGFFTEYEIVNTPPFAESITEGDVRWEKGIGDKVAEDEVVGEIETDKTSIPITASAPGVIVELFVEDGGMVEKGDKLFKIQVGAGVSDVQPKAEPDINIAAARVGEKEPETSVSVELSSSSIPLPVEEKPLGPIKVVRPSQLPSPPSTQQQLDIMQSESKEAPTELTGSRRETRVKMSRMRQRIALRLKDAQNMNAMLTTFNEVDMSNIMEMRKQHKDSFLKIYGLKLGFMSAFTKACSYALNSMPVVNAVIEDGYVIYRDYVDISVAVATPKGLVVPVLRDVQSMNYLEIEKGINDLGKKARNGELAIEDMDGGTFTISNGGVFGSLMGTPIINPPQSAILGLHSINDRPVAIDGQVVIRPMMYVALTYDHRLIDGREAVTFLRKVKAAVEDPRIILLNL